MSAGQPILTEDAWWHLSMGAAYAANGPWLSSDPVLHTAEGPPAPAAWAFQLGLHALERAFGLQGLRAVHAVLVAAILLAAWRLLRRWGASAELASVGTALFGALSAYRLFQLRPHLLTLLLALCVLQLLLSSREPPSWRRVAAAAGLFALWANVHGAFLVGLALLGAAAAGLTLAALGAPDVHAARARRLVAAFALCALATLLNPEGIGPHGLWFAAGDATPALSIVADEWARFAPFSWPVPGVPPSRFSWLALWALGLASLVIAGRELRSPRDPARLAAMLAALAGPFFAIRLAWLAIVPLAFLFGRSGGATRHSGAVAALGVATLAGFVAIGDWPMISRGVTRDRYAAPYPAGKIDAHAVWFLADAGLEGHLYNEYAEGNFLGYWLAPRMRVFLNGSLNVPLEVIEARRAVRRLQLEPGETLTDRLDRFGVDVFFGTGLPAYPAPVRPEVSNTTHLEGEPGWLQVFRNVRSALYLRDLPRNRENLARVAAYYARAGVPFDAEHGFDPVRATAEAPRWAIDHGLRPARLAEIEAAAQDANPGRRAAALERLGVHHAALGAYARAIDLAERQLAVAPAAIGALRRRVWAELHRGDGAAALRSARRLAVAAPPDDAVSALLVGEAGRAAGWAPDRVRRRSALFPLFARAELQQVLAGIQPPEPRARRELPANQGSPSGD